MLSLFGRKKPAPLGVDISSTAIKLVELARSGASTASPFRVEAYGIEPLPPNAVVEKKISDIQAAADAIKALSAKLGIKSKNAVVAVSGSAVITKIISMSASLSDSEMEAQIQLEADQYIPYALEEVNIDFDVLGPSSSGPEMVDVLLAASRRENVDDRVAALDLAGLTTMIVDVEAYAMENTCNLLLSARDEDTTEQTVAIADIGATTTTLHVLHDGQTIYTREQNFGGVQLLDEVQRRYSLSKEEALQQVIAGELPPDYIAEVLEPFKDALAQQIARALQFFYSSSPYNRADQVILAGGAASTRGITDTVEERLRIPVSVANPFTHMSLAPKVSNEQAYRDAPAMMVAVGLALRGLD